ncbi:chitobiase/beta-hexosaminidase C-terminal domain-containing protein, partial [Arthrospira platensis SPKY1]|nr:chitobiase/beta-hexosaminidase C-terminal domain-containing protein [Arthrospira platensis SPKY1]
VVPALAPDHSFGRKTDGDDEWVYFSAPSPEAANDGQATYGYALAPIVLPEGHFFGMPTEVQCSAPQSGCIVRYTTDGSEPTTDAPVYESPIPIYATTCIRARTFCPGLLPSVVISKTIFIDAHHRLPVVALSTHPDNWWNWESGILVDGPHADPEWPH